MVPVNMSRLVLLLTAMWLSTANTQLAFITDLTKNVPKQVSKEISAINGPLEKTLMSVGFSQCKNVKTLLGVDYDSFNNTEPDLSRLTLNFMTRSVNVTYQLTSAGQLISQSSWFNPSLPLKFYLHGFTDDPTKGSYTKINNAFLSQGDFNIVALDASSLIRWLYLRSTTMVRFIGEELGNILAALVRCLNPASIHLIGHSLGSHISGFAGKTFMAKTGNRVGRITGLDPAGPCFADVGKLLRLSSDDAEFVDVIHTDTGVYGLDKQIGHVDFYPNGGSHQPNCPPSELLACSHSRAWLLFAESVINPNAFVAVSCNDWPAFRNGWCNNNYMSLMGYGCRSGTTGAYYLQTAEETPYGLGIKGIKYVNNEGLVKNLGINLGLLKL